MESVQLTTVQDLRAAQSRIAELVHRTHQARSQYLSTISAARVSLKLELFQKTGSFKVRGVLNTLSQLTSTERARGVVSMSAGNHAQALAWGASQLGIASTIVMPATAARAKVDATRGYGGTVLLTEGDLLAAVTELRDSRGLTLIHPFDDPRIIAGQGTVGLEIAEDVPDVDVVLVGCGGGGLLGGVAAAIKAVRPTARVIGVEPEGSNVMSRSLAAGFPQRLTNNVTVADGLAPPFTGAHALAHVQHFVDDVITVSDSEILDGMRLLMERCKLFAEPSAGAAIAPLLNHYSAQLRNLSVVPIVCGGNVSLERLVTLLA